MPPFEVGLQLLLPGSGWLFLGWSSFLSSRWILIGGFGLLGLCFFPGALHGIDASLLAERSLLKLRSSVLKVVWSRRYWQMSVRCSACLMALRGVILRIVLCGLVSVSHGSVVSCIPSL